MSGPESLQDFIKEKDKRIAALEAENKRLKEELENLESYNQELIDFPEGHL